MRFHLSRWSILCVLAISAQVVRADIGQACPVYRSGESQLIDLHGADGKVLKLPLQAKQVMVRYEKSLYYASLRVLLNGQDISEQFRVDANNKIADDIVYLELPLQQGENMLHVSGYFSGDAQGASQKGCELPPLRWQQWSIVREPIKLGVTAEARRLSPAEANEVMPEKIF